MTQIRDNGFSNAAKEIAKQLLDGNQRALLKSALVVEASAVSKIRSDSGTLAGSITHQVFEDYAIVGTNVFYAPFVEYGTGIYAENGMGRKDRWTYFDENKKKWFTTVGNRPHPFMRPSFDENKKRIVGFFREELRKIS